MDRKNILIGISLSLLLFSQGCYTQLAMFYPEPEIEQENEDQFFETYSRAPGRPGLDIYAQDEGSMPLGYSTMQRRFNPFGGGYMGYMNPYGFYNNYNYGYGGYGDGYGFGYGNNMFGYSYNLGGYAMFIPVGDARALREFNKGRTNPFGTNLNVTRSSPRSSGNQNSSGYRNSSSVSSNRSSGSYSSGSSSSSSSSSTSSSGRRATRRN